VLSTPLLKLQQFRDGTAMCCTIIIFKIL